MARSAQDTRQQEEEVGGRKGGVSGLLDRDRSTRSRSPSPEPSRVEKRSRRPGLSSAYILPLPTIETIMEYPSLSRTLYDSLARGDTPAQSYRTVIHTPKPHNIGKSRRSRLRSNTTFSSGSTSSTNTFYDASASSSSSEANSSASSVCSEPSSPACPVVESAKTSHAAPASSSSYTFFPLSTPTGPRASIESSSEESASNSVSSTRSSSPSASFYSSHSGFETICDSASSSSIIIPSINEPEDDDEPGSRRHSFTTFPSPPGTPQPPTPDFITASTWSSSSNSAANTPIRETFLDYPSPPATPGNHHQTNLSPTPSPTLSSLPPLTRSSSQSSHTTSLASPARHQPIHLHPSLLPSIPDFGETGEHQLGTGPLFPQDELPGDWSLNGGQVVFGAAGVAVSRRLLEERERLERSITTTTTTTDGGVGGLASSSGTSVQGWRDENNILHSPSCECERCGWRLGDAGFGGLYVIEEDVSGEEREGGHTPRRVERRSGRRVVQRRVTR